MFLCFLERQERKRERDRQTNTERKRGGGTEREGENLKLGEHGGRVYLWAVAGEEKMSKIYCIKIS